MPPSLPRCSLSTLKSYSSSRAFSTYNPLRSIGPESPRFIEIPQPPQQVQHAPRIIKGVLPPPRNVFPLRAGDKTDPKYFAAVTPEPTAHRQLSAPKDSYIAWKRRIAESRRTNLREGLLALRKRKNRQDAAVAKISLDKRKARNRLLRMPQREDERLMSPTIISAMQKVRLDHSPESAEVVARKAARVQMKETVKEEQRRNALHTLYMHARSFITTEELLHAEIEKIFVPQPFLPNHLGDNIWDAHGAPITVQDMLSEINNTQKKSLGFHKGPAQITGQRMKKIAEELTGGKMDWKV
ncbi:hypothetical protein B7494_g552 [Chlorociboria aeruginascens]|nr:hypothetical protein B7494_g552 [Chlorociboria aeruginascens]